MSIKDISVADEMQLLNKIEEEQHKAIDEEVRFEKELEEYKVTIAKSLLTQKSLTVNIDGRMFALGYKIENIMRDYKNTKVLKLVCLDVMMAKLSKRKKGQTTICLDYVKEMGLNSNLEAAIEAFLRNLTGTFKAEHKNDK